LQLVGKHGQELLQAHLLACELAVERDELVYRTVALGDRVGVVMRDQAAEQRCAAPVRLRAEHRGGRLASDHQRHLPAGHRVAAALAHQLARLVLAARQDDIDQVRWRRDAEPLGPHVRPPDTSAGFDQECKLSASLLQRGAELRGCTTIGHVGLNQSGPCRILSMLSTRRQASYEKL
jgi:hypothetical protein